MNFDLENFEFRALHSHIDTQLTKIYFFSLIFSGPNVSLKILTERLA